MEEKKILATVGEREITERDVNLVLQSMDQQKAMQYYTKDGRKRVLNELINQELFYLDAIDMGLDKEEEFKQQLEQTKASLLKQYAINKLLNTVKIDEDEVENYYSDNKENFKNPETVKASHILVDQKEKAEEVLKEINEGLSFEEAAKKYSKCPSKEKGGDLGYFAKGRMVPEFEKAAFNMEIDEIDGPVKTQFGYHLIKVYDKKEAEIIPLEEIRDRLRQQLIVMKQNELYYNKSNELKERYQVRINE
jgi:peptidyl-prolyl cis-trans isomerase C